MADVVKVGLEIPNRIFVGGIAYDTCESELKDCFERFGHVKDVKIITDKDGVSKGYGFVTFETSEEARQAQKQGNIFFKEKRLNLGPAIRQKGIIPSDSPSELTNSSGLFMHSDGCVFSVAPNGTWNFLPRDPWPGATMMQQLTPSPCPVLMPDYPSMVIPDYMPGICLGSGGMPCLPPPAVESRHVSTTNGFVPQFLSPIYPVQVPIQTSGVPLVPPNLYPFFFPMDMTNLCYSSPEINHTSPVQDSHEGTDGTQSVAEDVLESSHNHTATQTHLCQDDWDSTCKDCLKASPKPCCPIYGGSQTKPLTQRQWRAQRHVGNKTNMVHRHRSKILGGEDLEASVHIMPSSSHVPA